MSAKTKTYRVTVLRYFEEETAEIDVEATNIKDAERLAIKEAEANAETYFGLSPEPSFCLEPTHEIEEV